MACGTTCANTIIPGWPEAVREALPVPWGSTMSTNNSGTFEQKVLQEGVDFTITDAIPIGMSVLAPDGGTLYVNRMALDRTGLTLDEVKGKGHLERTCHPDDLDRVLDERRTGLSRGVRFELEMRLLPKGGTYRWYVSQYNPLKDESGKIIRWYVTATDIDDRKRAEEKLRRSEQELRTITDTIRQPIVALAPDGSTLYANRVALDLTGLTIDELDKKGLLAQTFHPDDVLRMSAERQQGLSSGAPFDSEVRVLFKGGQYRWHLLQYNPLKDETGQIIRWYATATDIDDRRRAEERLRQSEENLRTIIDTIRQVIVVLAPDGTTLYANRVVLDQTGFEAHELRGDGFVKRVFHPDDLDRFGEKRRAGLLKGVPFEVELRAWQKSGEYRWKLVQYNPLKDDHGKVIRWYATATDIDDQKKTEERLRNENLVLREEIDRSSMFEEIVGSSKPIHQLLKKVEKVAPSDSTVLILGETGTGKELIARALHRRSKRANRAFVRVNCAAIPQSLIASELFGHEKGAFTGALQRRVGRFEAANGGTLFLDEIGELPMETQIALLRVLQEREFERVGSNHPISVDVRLIAATNRDLPAAVAAGTFRQDLFFRLNVFPIAVPSLRERAEDIPLLVEYFVGRYAKEAGKNIRQIGKETLEQLQSYQWPGNIRELQNVVERAVILSETETFDVDESWLNVESASPSQQEGLSALDDREVEMIEAALAESHGRISGPSGAAAKLGIPRQTLESKIRRLGIDKYGQKRTTFR
jgi:formate hydrogenlyase transcriptional activator